MNLPIIFLMIIFIFFIILIFLYNINRIDKYIKSEWVDVKLLGILYLLSFGLFTVTVTESKIKNILPLAIFVLILQLFWSIYIAILFIPSVSIIFSTLSFLTCALMTQLIDKNLQVGLLPFLFFTLVQIAISINISENNPDKIN